MCSAQTATAAGRQLQSNQPRFTNAAVSFNLDKTEKIYPGRSNDCHAPTAALRRSGSGRLNREGVKTGSGRKGRDGTYQVNELRWQCIVRKIRARKPMHHVAAASGSARPVIDGLTPPL